MMDFLEVEAHTEAQMSCSALPNSSYAEQFSNCSGKSFQLLVQMSYYKFKVIRQDLVYENIFEFDQLWILIKNRTALIANFK